MELDGRRIVVTGAASGIGQALLAQLAAYDAQIVAADRDPISVPQGRATIHVYQGDLSEQAAVDALFECAISAIGGVDLLFANAGFAYYETLRTPDWERMAQIYRVNVFSPVYSLLRMRQLNPTTPYTVVVTASTIARMAVPGYAHYGATKAAIHHFAQSTRFDAPSNERLMLVYPIATRTSFFRTAHDRTPLLYPNQTPDRVARAMIQGVLNDRETVNPSRTFSVFWRVSAVVPGLRWIYQRYALWLLHRWQRDH